MHSAETGDLAGLGRVVGVRAARIVEVDLAVAVVVGAVRARLAAPPCRRGVGVGGRASARRLGPAAGGRVAAAGGGAGGAGGCAGGAPSPSLLSTSAALAGAALPHSLAASTPARPFTSAEPFSRLPSSPARSLQFGALPPLSAAAIVLTPFALPLTRQHDLAGRR